MLPLLPDSGSQCESAENEEWFNRFNDILKSILLEFREGRPALDLCTQLLKTTNVVYEDAANVDKRGLTALTAISARLLFAEIEKKPSLQPAVSHLLRFVTVVFSSADSKEIAFSYIEGLLSTVPSFAKKLPSETVDAVGSVVNYVLLNANLNSEFYNVDKKYIVGFVFSVLLDLFSDESADSNVRIKVGELMLQMCTPSESYEIIAFLLPGICQSTVKVMCCIGIKSYKITTIALKVFTQVVTLVFGTENVKSRDEKWLEQSVQRIVQMINKISNRLSASSDHRVREVVLESMIYLHYKCQGIFESQIDEPLVDLLVNFSVDAYESLSSKAYSKLCVIRQQKNSFLFKRLTTQLHYLCSRLPYAVENSLSGEPLVLDRIYAVMHALGMEDLERVVRCSPHFVGQFLDGMASSVRIDMKRLKLSSEGVNTPEWKALSLYPLKFSVNAKHLNNIATELMQTECSEIIFDHIVDRISASTFKQDKIGYFLLSACFLHTGNSAISSYFQATLKTLRKLVDAIEFDVKDEKIEDLQTQHSDDSCLAALALTALGEAMAQVDPNKEQFKKLMLDVLYDTLQFCGSTNLVVKTAAEHVIVDLATTENVTQSALLLRFAPFLVHRLYVESRDFLSNLRSPVMLIQLLHHCDDPLLYGQVRFIMTDLLKALDRYDQQWTVLILRALLAFIQAVSNWYPDLTPAPQSNNNLCPMRDETEPDSDDDDEKENATVIEDEAKEEVPKPVTSVVEILMRTKHMISSPHLPIKILVLDILEASLRTVRNFENQLLPMIHQNWQGLVMRFKLPWADISTDDLLVATKALQIAVTMCELSRTFVYRKVVDDMWPLVARYLEIASKESRVTSKAYSHTSAFKYQMAVIKSAEPIVIHLSLKTEIEREKIVKLLEIYSGDEAQNCYLRDEAQRVLYLVNQFK